MRYTKAETGDPDSYGSSMEVVGGARGALFRGIFHSHLHITVYSWTVVQSAKLSSSSFNA